MMGGSGLPTGTGGGGGGGSGGTVAQGTAAASTGAWPFIITDYGGTNQAAVNGSHQLAVAGPVSLNTTPTLANGNGVVPTIAGAVYSATNGEYANILQGNVVLSATNGLFANALQGNAVLSGANPLFAALSIGGAVDSATNGVYVNLLQGNAVNASGNPIFASITNTPAVTVSGVATAANQTNASQKTQIVDGSGNVIGSSSNALEVDCTAGCSSSSSITGWAGGTLGAMANYGTSPGSVLVPAVNAFVTGAIGPAQGSTTSGQTGSLVMGAASTNAPTATTGDTWPLSISPASGGVRIDLKDSAANTNPFLVNPGTIATWGLAANGGTLATNGLQIAGQAVNAEATATTNGKQVTASFDLVGKQITSPFANKENYVKGTTAAMTGTSSTQVIAAVSSQKLYITAIHCNNSSSTATLVSIQDGSGGTTLDTLAANSAYGGEDRSGASPLFWTTAGNGLYAADVTTGASVICQASGYSGV
jgi:hypothetical protein